MDITVLNKDLDAIAVVDIYESFIWTDRYYQYGDFELYTPMTSTILEHFKQDYYLQMRGSDRLMIIEKLLIASDSENGDHITITGRSLESILDRRIIWGQMTVNGSFQDAIETLLNACIISPSNVNRKISNFIFQKSTDPRITALTLEAQYTGDNLYEVIQKLCEERGVGFKVTLNDDKQFVFSLYIGTDRSYEQTDVPYVVFSPSFDNVISSNYVESKSSLKNTALIGGEGEGSERRYTSVGNPIGLDRREMFVDARDISSDVGDGQILTDEEYKSLLIQRGRENLAENVSVTSFEGQMETSIMYKYGEDFFDGDIVQMMNEYGHSAKVRVLEVITSENEEGISVYPTFATVEEEAADPDEPEDILPDGYEALSYIESNGTQYIDTGFQPNQNTRLVLDVNLLTETTYPKAIFGARAGSSSGSSFTFWKYAAQQFRSDFGVDNKLIDINTSGRYSIDKDKAKTSVTSISTTLTATNTAATFQTQYNLTLFAVNDSQGVDERRASMRLYSCKIYSNDVLVRDFIPAKNSAGVVGLYDIVGETFYINSGAGAFIAG